MMAQYDADPYLQQLFSLLDPQSDPYAEGVPAGRIPEPVPDAPQTLIRGMDGNLVNPYTLSPEQLRQLGFLAAGEQPPEKNKRGPR